VRLHRRAGAVGREFQHDGRAGQLLTPEGHLRLEHLPAQPPALPVCEVGVLHLQLGQRRRLPLAERTVEGDDLLDHHAHRPRVAGDVMERQQHDVVVLADLYQHDSQQRTLLQVERLSRRHGREAVGLRLSHALTQFAQVDHGQFDRPHRVDDLHRLAVDGDEGRAQRLVAAHHLGQRLAHRRHVEAPGQAHRHRHVVDRTLRLQLVEEPEALLREGDRQRAVAGDGDEGRGREAGAAQHGLLDGQGEAAESGLLEEAAQRDLDGEGAAHARHQLGGEQGVAAQLEEVVGHPDALDAQQLAPDAGQHLFD
jgi:hypothetical protein